MYNCYLFDLYGTLVDIHTDEEKEELWERLSMFYGYYGALYTPEELRQSYLLEVEQRQKQARCTLKISHEANPEIELEYVFQALFNKKGVQADLAQSIYAAQVFRVISTQYIQLYDGVKELLEALRSKGKAIYLLSNAQNIFTRYELRYLGIEHLFDDIFISSQYGCKKPDSSFYMKPIEKYKIKPQESIMIGNDYKCDILGAKGVGLDTFYIHSNLSPDLEQEVESTYFLQEMDLRRVKEILIQND